MAASTVTWNVSMPGRNVCQASKFVHVCEVLQAMQEEAGSGCNLHCPDVAVANNIFEPGLPHPEGLLHGDPASAPGPFHSIRKSKAAVEASADAVCPIQEGPQVASLKRACLLIWCMGNLQAKN